MDTVEEMHRTRVIPESNWNRLRRDKLGPPPRLPAPDVPDDVPHPMDDLVYRDWAHHAICYARIAQEQFIGIDAGAMAAFRVAARHNQEYRARRGPPPPREVVPPLPWGATDVLYGGGAVLLVAVAAGAIATGGLGAGAALALPSAKVGMGSLAAAAGAFFGFGPGA